MIYKLMSLGGIILLFGAYVALSFNYIELEMYYILNFQASYLLAHSAYGRKMKEYIFINSAWCLVSFINII